MLGVLTISQRDVKALTPMITLSSFRSTLSVSPPCRGLGST
jgi:hypothetical protein